LSLIINKISNNIYEKNQNKKPDNIYVPMQGNNSLTNNTDKTQDRKFSTSEALKNFAKGMISPVTSMFSSMKNFAIGAGMIAGSALLLAATGGAAAPLLVVTGVSMGLIQAGGAAYKITKAKNGDDVEKAFYDIGGATSVIGLSVLGAKSSLKQANLEIDGLSSLSSVRTCFTSVKKLSQENFNVFKSGYYRVNLSNTFKFLAQPKSLRQFSNELFKEGQENFLSTFDNLKNALPKEFRPYLRGRSKCELSIYEKLIKERTSGFRNKIEKIQNVSEFSEEIKQQKIAQLLERTKKLATDKSLAKENVHDLYGMRLNLRDIGKESTDKIVNSLIEAIQKGDIKILEIENYRGANSNFSSWTKFYFSPAQIRKLQEVSSNPIEIVFQKKHSGYTATQMKIQSKNGAIMEFQIRGEHVHDLAKIEHIPYDLRQGKDIAKGNNQIGIILTKVQKAIKQLNEKQFVEYERYIYENYVYAQAQEFGKPAIKPPLPEGMNPVLSVESLTDLYQQAKSLSPGGIELPFNVYSQAAFITGAQNLPN
jgi:hypothetical protein